MEIKFILKYGSKRKLDTKSSTKGYFFLIKIVAKFEICNQNLFVFDG